MKKVYLAGPYSHFPPGGSVADNVITAIDAAHVLLDHGFVPYTPHLSHFLEARRSRPYEEWMQLDLAWLACCEALVRLPGHSPGADREVHYALWNGIAVYNGLAALLRTVAKT